MSRRSTPERIDDARRAAVRARLIGERMPEARVDELLALWRDQAARDGLTPGADYWQAFYAWTTSRRP